MNLLRATLNVKWYMLHVVHGNVFLLISACFSACFYLFLLLVSIADGGAFIAEGTRDNDTLNWLDLTSNSIGGEASMVFANALEQVRRETH